MTGIDLRLGRWENVLADVECDALIVDAPYSERTHGGHDTGADAADRARRIEQYDSGQRRSTINYAPWTPADVEAFVASWSPRTRGWMVSITDHTLFPAWAGAMEAAGRYVFAPLPFINRGSGCRYAGDGPSNWTCWIAVARPRTREAMKWGTLPGAYECPPGFNDRGGGAGHGQQLIAGGKPLWLMRSLVRDYSRHGEIGRAHV